jgi:Carboxymuconolactone decarboxylase family
VSFVREAGLEMSDDYQQKSLAERSVGIAVPPQTKIRITEDHDATGDVAAAYDYWRAGSGRQKVPGIIKCFGSRPDFLRQVVDFSNKVHFSEGHLSRRHKEMIASRVSYLNRCPY